MILKILVNQVINEYNLNISQFHILKNKSHVYRCMPSACPGKFFWFGHFYRCAY